MFEGWMLGFTPVSDDSLSDQMKVTTKPAMVNTKLLTLNFPQIGSKPYSMQTINTISLSSKLPLVFSLSSLSLTLNPPILTPPSPSLVTSDNPPIPLDTDNPSTPSTP